MPNSLRRASRRTTCILAGAVLVGPDSMTYLKWRSMSPRSGCAGSPAVQWRLWSPPNSPNRDMEKGNGDR